MKRFFNIVLFIALCASTLFAQTSKKYDGPMRIPSDLYLLKDFDPRSNEIRGTYSYYENEEEDRIKHGDFKIVFVADNFNREVKGRYEHGKKTGTWTVKDIVTGVKTNYLKHMELSFNFKDDFLDGPLTGVIHNRTTAYTVNCSFSKGRMTGKYHLDIADEWEKGITYEVNGTFGDDGMPTGIWILKQKGGIEVTQKRLYLNGALVYIQEQDFSTGAKTLPFCAFSGVTKAPAAEEITVSTSEEGSYLTYQNIVAPLRVVQIGFYGDASTKGVMKKCTLPIYGQMWVSDLVQILPESMWRYAKTYYDILDMPDDIWTGPQPFAAQRMEWKGYYADKERGY